VSGGFSICVCTVGSKPGRSWSRSRGTRISTGQKGMNDWERDRSRRGTLKVKDRRGMNSGCKVLWAESQDFAAAWAELPEPL
jgi:hypothetical protein